MVAHCGQERDHLDHLGADLGLHELDGVARSDRRDRARVSRDVRSRAILYVDPVPAMVPEEADIPVGIL